MRKTLKDIRMLASLLLAGAALLSCSSDDETPASTPETPETPKTCTMTVQATKGADTRALAVDGTELASTWTAGDVVTVLSSDEATTYGKLTAQSSGASTTLTGTLETAPANGASLLLKYLSASYGAQDGTLTGTDNSIDKVCDYSTATVTATVTGDGSDKHVTTDAASFANQQAIVKFTLTDGTNAINATALTVSDGTNNITLSNIPADTYTANGDGVLYVALPGFSGKTVSLTAATSSSVYTYSKGSITFDDSKFYRIQVTMAPATGKVPGLLDGKFTVNGSGKQVSFSQGNLQATYNGANWTWSFATTQWGYIGNAAGNTSINGNGTVSASNVTVDLFGWVGESSTVLTTSPAKYGISNSTTHSDYGTKTSDALMSDWGTLMGSGWRTLTADEWKYLLDTRSTTSDIRYAKATVNGVTGLILLPDNWNSTYYSLTSTNTTNAAFTTNNIIESDWSNSLAAHGAVFLPAAGFRGNGAEVYNAGTSGEYWSSTLNASDASRPYLVIFTSNDLNSQHNGRFRRNGLSVRLVRAVE